jgi:hypothetical protein
MAATGAPAYRDGMSTQLTLERVEISFVGPPPVAQIERASGVTGVEQDGAVVRCLVAGSFQPLLEAVRGHEVLTLQSTAEPGPPPRTELSLWRLYLLRLGYLVLGGGLVVYKWPLLFNHDNPWPLIDSVVVCMLVGMSIIALLGLRYPVQMLPILLFEVAWKMIWLGAVALPQWQNHQMDAATRELTNEVLWVVIIVAVIPWRYVFSNYLTKRAERWR